MDWNPLFLKDLRVYLRDPKWGRVGWWGVATLSVPAVALLALQFAFPGVLSRIGRYVLLGYGVFQNILALGAVAVAATSIVAEREKNTYEVLQVSPVSPERLFLGKMLFAAYTVATRQALLLVPMAVVYLSGGFPFDVLLLFQLVLLASDVMVSSLGVYISAQPHRLPKIRFAALKGSATKTQVALQKAMGISVVFLILVPFYAVIIPTMAGAAAAGRAAAGRGGSVNFLPDLSLLGTLCPAVSLAFWDDVGVFGFGVPLWLLSIACNLLLAAMFFFFGVGQLRGRERDMSIGGRACLAGFVLLAVTLLVGTVGISSRYGPFVVVVAVAILFLVFLAPSLSVGELTKDEQKAYGRETLLNSLSPRRLLRSRASGAGGFLVALLLLSAPILWAALGVETLPLVATLLAVVFAIAALGARQSRNAKDGPPNKAALASSIVMIFVVSTIVPVVLKAGSEVSQGAVIKETAEGTLAAILPLNPIASLFLRATVTTGKDVAELAPLREQVGSMFSLHAWMATCAWYTGIGLLALLWPRKKEEKPGEAKKA